MQERRRDKGGAVIALLMIGLGAWYLAGQFFAPLRALAYGPHTWPYQILVLAALLALTGLVAWVPGLIIPAAIIGGIGGILLYQNTTGAWWTWVFAWTLIPGFVGVGLLLYGLLTRRAGALIGALWTLFASAVLFGIFGWVFASLEIAGLVWPAALILFGALLLVQAVRRRA